MEQMNRQQISNMTPLWAAVMLANPASAATQLSTYNVGLAGEHGTFTSVCAPWVHRQIAQLHSLQAEWSAFDADPLQTKTISQLRALLAVSHRPTGLIGQIVPGADGSLQAEWHLKNIAIGLLVEDDGTYSSWIRFHDTDKDIERQGSEALPFFQTLANQYRLNV